MQAISTIIASILMLMIVIALGGTTYLYISGIFTGKISTTFELIDSVNDTVTIRNDGTGPITFFSTAIIDGTPAVYRVSVQDPSLVAYWKFDEGQDTTAFDSSGKGNDGTINGASWSAEKYGSALKFDGLNDLVTAPPLGIKRDISVSIWVKPNSTTAVQRIINSADIVSSIPRQGWELMTYPDLPASYLFAAGTGPSYDWANAPLSYLTTEWTHVVGTYDGSTLRIYINGILVDTTAMTNNDISNTNTTYIGQRNAIAQYYFNGTLDEVRVYNRALSEQEIKGNYNIGSQINPGEIATMKIYNTLLKGTHTLRLCTSSMCNTAYLMVQ